MGISLSATVSTGSVVFIRDALNPRSQAMWAVLYGYVRVALPLNSVLTRPHIRWTPEIFGTRGTFVPQNANI